MTASPDGWAPDGRSAFDLFRRGLGPSSSHTSGPMRAACAFALAAPASTARVRVTLHGSLAATGAGHGTPRAMILGLSGIAPENADPAEAERLEAEVSSRRRVRLPGGADAAFDPSSDLVLDATTLPAHPNGMVLEALGADGAALLRHERYSIGGGFVSTAEELSSPQDSGEGPPYPWRFDNGEQLLDACQRSGLSVSGVMMANEGARGRTPDEVRAGMLDIWHAMRDCIDAGCATDGTLPGGLQVRRRAGGLIERAAGREAAGDGLANLDRVAAWAIAVNEENAAGGRVVTAPTNGAAGVVPAVLRHCVEACVPPEEAAAAAVSFLLAAAAIGAIIKLNASISGADVGCQGEIGSACAMASAGLAEALGATPAQVENAAEIGLEHNLGLTCDPVGGLVQVPCIERNAQAAAKAVCAARLALAGDGAHVVSLDQAVRVLRNTGRDMKDSYKETAKGGLAAVIRIPVSVVEC